MKTHTLTLPWFSRRCSPNSKRNNWRVKHEARKKQKVVGAVIAKALPKVKHDKNIPIDIKFYPVGKGNDLDNCLASIKGALDGIANELGVNDSRFRPITIDFGENTKPPKIEVALTF